MAQQDLNIGTPGAGNGDLLPTAFQKVQDNFDDLYPRVTANDAKRSYPAADESKLAGIEAGATADQSGAEIKAALEAVPDTKTVTDAEKSKIGNLPADTQGDLNQVGLALDGKAAAAHTHPSSDVTDFQDAVSAHPDVVANTAKRSYPSADESKLAGIEAGATADQSDAEIETAYNNRVAKASAPEIAAGTEANVRRFSVADVKAMIDAHAAGGLAASDIDTLAELNAILTDATLIDTTDPRLSDNRDPNAHTHTKSDVTDFPASVSGSEALAGFSTLDRIWSAYRVSQASGIRITDLTAGEALAEFDAVYLASDGKLYKADNTNETKIKGLLGIVLWAVALDETVDIQIGGQITVTGPLTLNTPYFVGTSGGMTTTPPTTGNYTRVLGYARSATVFRIQVDPTYVEVGDGTVPAHTHPASEIPDFDTEVGNHPDVVANTAKRSYPSADETKLAGIESGATADQTGAEIKAAYEAEADTNAFTDAEKTKLAGVETGATADQTDAEILAAVESESGRDMSVDGAKLDGIGAGASVRSDTTEGGTGSAAVGNIVSISQAAYDALTPDADTLYIITS